MKVSIERPARDDHHTIWIKKGPVVLEYVENCEHMRLSPKAARDVFEQLKAKLVPDQEIKNAHS